LGRKQTQFDKIHSIEKHYRHLKQDLKSPIHNHTKATEDHTLPSKGISIYSVKNINTFRACITIYNTVENDLDELVNELNHEREDYVKRNN